MSFPYMNIAKAVALRANQLAGAIDAAAAETAFAGTLSTNMTGMEIPYSALRMQILASEKYIASVIGRCKNPVLRKPLIARTPDINSSEDIPMLSVDDYEFVGNFGGCFDSVNDQALTEKPKQTIERYNRGAGWRLPKYHYCIEDARAYHTRGAVYFTGCVWDFTERNNAYGTNGGQSSLPQEAEIWLTAHTLANLPQESWFIDLAGWYAQIAEKCEMRVLQGLLPEAILPDTTANQEPVKN